MVRSRASRAVSRKLFGGENDDCEVYRNIDSTRGIVQLADKDPEYHEPLLALLREP
jgi:hypothetical protein